MSYLVLARKYRSQSFSEIIAQDHVTQTLQNAILAGRLAHAILFCGPRGTGKTSIARILAKAMNCAQGSSPFPCNTCRSCMEITAGNGVDVMEIDGASNNSVDQIRDLREGLGYMPAHSPYRIYIIDEVHMLSTAAFNALLKTLEEPPSHVLFFFATTEAHKIPLTILSRCQRHDLRRVSTPVLTAHLASLCQRESVLLEEEALDMIAREADGSVRDALSLLDRVISSLDGGQGNREDVARILGIAARSQAFQTADALFRGDTGRMLTLIRDLHDGGVDLRKFHGDLSNHIRNLLVAKMQPKDCGEFLDLPDTMVQDLLSQSRPLTEHYLSRLLDILMGEDGSMRHASHPRLALETLLLRCIRIQPALSIDRLVERLEILRQDMLNGEENTSLSAPSLLSAPLKAEGFPTIPQTPPPPAPEKKPAEPAARPPASSPDPRLSELPPSVLPAPSPPASVPVPPPRTATLPHGKKETLWPSLISRLREVSPSLGDLLATKTTLKKLSDQSMELEVQGSGSFIARLTHEKNRQLVETHAAELFGTPLSLVIHVTEENDSAALRSQSEKELLRNDATTHPLVQDALDIFKGKVVDITFLKEAR